MKHPSPPYRRPWLWLLALLWLGIPLSGQAAEDGQADPYQAMSAEELSQEWKNKLGAENFQALELPSLIRPGGNYGPRLFYFSEPAIIGLDGNAVKGRLSIGAEDFDYSRAVSPPRTGIMDTAVTYYAIRSAQFEQIVKQQFGALESTSLQESGKWNLALISESMGIPGNMNSYLQDWENLPNFTEVISSILVRRASQQSSTLELVLNEGQLQEYDRANIVNGEGGRNGLLTALYNPSGLGDLGGNGQYPTWMLLAAFGIGLVLPLGFIILRPKRRNKRSGDPGEVEVLEEDPRFLNLRRDLAKAQEPMDMLKALYVHFEDSDAINTVLTQTKLSLDKNAKAAPKKESPASEENASENADPQPENKEGEEASGQERKRATIKIKSEDIRKRDSVEASVEEEKTEEKKKKSPEEEPGKKTERMVKKDGRVREVVKEVVREVVREKIDNAELQRRLENQETAEEKLRVAIAYWDSAYSMDGALTRELKVLLRSHRIYHKVKSGFEADNLRSALSELALSFGKGHTTRVKRIMDRSDLIDQFVKDVEADRIAPEANRDDERGRTAAHLSEVVRAMQFSNRISQKELPGGSRADYQKATESILSGFVMDGTARDVASGRSFDEMRARFEGRLALFQDDVRFAGNQIPDETVKRINKLVHSFAGEADSNIYYEAFLLRYGDLFDKLTRYEDPPTLEELINWWSQVFEMVIHAFDYFRYSVEGKENSLAKLNVMMVLEGLKLHELPDGDVRPFSERVTDVPRAVRNAREMARSIGIARLDRVLIDGYYIHPKALEPVEE